MPQAPRDRFKLASFPAFADLSDVVHVIPSGRDGQPARRLLISSGYSQIASPSVRLMRLLAGRQCHTLKPRCMTMSACADDHDVDRLTRGRNAYTSAARVAARCAATLHRWSRTRMSRLWHRATVDGRRERTEGDRADWGPAEDHRLGRCGAVNCGLPPSWW